MDNLPLQLKHWEELWKRLQVVLHIFVYEPIETDAGHLRLVKVRKSDPKFTQIGDADFNVNYKNFKEKYRGNPQFELIKRDAFEMLRLSDPDFDVMACFSNNPKSKVLRIKL